jgi:transposase
MTEPQRVLVQAAVRFVAGVDGQATMVRMAAFFLLHADMKLSSAQVGAAVGRTGRAMSTVQSLSAREFLDSVWSGMGRHRKPKLSAEQAGPIALYLVDHPGCTHSEMVSFIRRSFDIQVDPLTLRRFFKTYGLGVLREDRRREGDDEHPFGSGARAMVGRSSSSLRRSR